MTWYNYSGHISRGGKSSVDVVLTKTDRIFILFEGRNQESMEYVYIKNQIGTTAYNRIIALAIMGKGLNSYIKRNRIPGSLA